VPLKLTCQSDDAMNLVGIPIRLGRVHDWLSAAPLAGFWMTTEVSEAGRLRLSPRRRRMAVSECSLAFTAPLKSGTLKPGRSCLRKSGRHAFLAALFLLSAKLTFLSAQSGEEPPREHAGKIVTKILRADYEGNRAALDELYAELLPFVDNPQVRARIRYWRGFAKWRRAINGANESPKPADLVRDLADGEAEFSTAVQLDPSFEDGKIGAASCAILRIYFEGTFSRVKDYASLGAIMAPSGRLLKEAREMEPDNPRLLWVVGQNQWNVAATSEAQSDVMKTYERGLKSVRAGHGTVADPLEPSWGEPELLMNMAWSYLHQKDPNPDAAEQYARSALKLVPYWHYVRDILLTQILDAKQKGH